jgi:hypothetical protein
MDERQAKRDIAFGTLGFIWGSLIVVFGIFNPGVPSASSAYDTGQFAGIVFGVLFAVAGFYYRRRGYRTRRRLQEDRPSS